MLDQFALSLEDSGLAVRFQRGAPDEVSLDRDLVTQVVANLVSNVEKYAVDGQLLEITTSRDGDVSAVEVRDHGPGVRPTDARRIFDPFTRADDAITEGVSGTGIGLALARELTRRHGGDLELVPVDEGACFRATFRHQEGAGR